MKQPEEKPSWLEQNRSTVSGLSVSQSELVIHTSYPHMDASTYGV